MYSMFILLFHEINYFFVVNRFTLILRLGDTFYFVNDIVKPILINQTTS